MPMEFKFRQSRAGQPEKVTAVKSQGRTILVDGKPVPILRAYTILALFALDIICLIAMFLALTDAIIIAGPLVIVFGLAAIAFTIAAGALSKN